MTTGTMAAIEVLERAMREPAERWGAAAWQQPSFCPGWSYAALFAHLLQVAELATDGVRRGLRGDGGPPPDAADLLAWRDARRERNAALSALPPAELLRAYDGGVAALHAAFADAATADQTLPAWHPAGTQTIAWWPGQWLFETTIHDWDLRAPRDGAAELHPAALPAMARLLPPRLTRWFDTDRHGGLNGTISVSFTDQPATPAAFRLTAGRLTAVDAATTAPTSTITTDVSAFSLVATFRRPSTGYAAQGRWQIEGDQAFGAAFSGGFRAV